MTLVLGRTETGFYTTDIENKDLYYMGQKMIPLNLQKYYDYYGKDSVDNFLKKYGNKPTTNEQNQERVQDIQQGEL